MTERGGRLAIWVYYLRAKLWAWKILYGYEIGLCLTALVLASLFDACVNRGVPAGSKPKIYPADEMLPCENLLKSERILVGETNPPTVTRLVGTSCQILVTAGGSLRISHPQVMQSTPPRSKTE